MASLLQVKSHKDLVHFETAYVVKLHNVARLAPSQPVRHLIRPLICPYFGLSPKIELTLRYEQNLFSCFSVSSDNICNYLIIFLHFP